MPDTWGLEDEQQKHPSIYICLQGSIGTACLFVSDGVVHGGNFLFLSISVKQMSLPCISSVEVVRSSPREDPGIA